MTRPRLLAVALACLGILLLSAAMATCEEPDRLTGDGAVGVLKLGSATASPLTSTLENRLPRGAMPIYSDSVWRGPIGELSGGTLPCARYAWTPPTWTSDYALCGGCQTSREAAQLPSDAQIRAVQQGVLAYLHRAVADGRLVVRLCAPIDVQLGYCAPDPWDSVKLPPVAWVEGWSICTCCGVGGGCGSACFAGLTDFSRSRIVISTCEPARTLPLVAYETANTIAGQARLSEPGSADSIYDSAWIGRATEAALNIGK